MQLVAPQLFPKFHPFLPNFYAFLIIGFTCVYQLLLQPYTTKPLSHRATEAERHCVCFTREYQTKGEKTGSLLQNRKKPYVFSKHRNAFHQVPSMSSVF